jgi:hypothetical protein
VGASAAFDEIATAAELESELLEAFGGDDMLDGVFEGTFGGDFGGDFDVSLHGDNWLSSDDGSDGPAKPVATAAASVALAAT